MVYRLLCNAICRNLFYDTEGRLQESIVMAPSSEVVAMSVEVGQWHKAESLESGTVILECKDGKYTPLTEEEVMG
ncbi:MAG: WbuC family cupin fold metalloprotein [Bacteroidales bacterium]|nr:WbuC family cupin fold metalloprotein [Bacteroidales bacterium]